MKRANFTFDNQTVPLQEYTESLRKSIDIACNEHMQKLRRMIQRMIIFEMLSNICVTPTQYEVTNAELLEGPGILCSGTLGNLSALGLYPQALAQTSQAPHAESILRESYETIFYTCAELCPSG